ncbi:acyl-CoA thioesterase [Variovorax boronicumulans]|nr:thioesterase family protein [Variovorax boronicumulans]
METSDINQFNFTYRRNLELNFRDFDSFQHVNNGVYFLWFENARVNLSMEVLQIFKASALPITMANIGCQFLCPIKIGDCVWIEAGISKVSEKSFELTYRVHEKLNGLCAVGTSIQVYFDHQTGRSSIFPTEVKNQLLHHSALKKRIK